MKAIEIVKQNKILVVLVSMAIAIFAIFYFPNRAASENLSMIQMFEPDESAPLPYLIKMIAPAENLDKTLRQFIFYEYYFYGFPYFGYSALVLLPLQWLEKSSDLSMVMLALRQFVSVLPAILGLLLLVYMQDRFRTYRSIVLFGVLLTVPAVLHNNFWWHPDGMVILLTAVIIFLLQRDNLSFGRNFFGAAFFCGVLTAAKLVGAYYFLAVGLVLFLGLFLKRISWKKFIWLSTAFIAIMAVSFVIANPFLLSSWGRIDYWNKFKLENSLLSEGYGIVYQKGLAAAWPTIHQYYGSAVFILVAIGAAVWGAIRGPQRLLHALILATGLPLTMFILTYTHFKYQYWLPAALPLFSSLIILFPEKIDFRQVRQPTFLARAALVLIVLGQTAFFVKYDIQQYDKRLHRAENNPRILFYEQAVAELAPATGSTLAVYYDYRLYVPDTNAWKAESTYDLLNYAYIQQNQFDVLLLLDQRIRDYLNPSAVGIDAAEFEQNRKFYQDAMDDTITGYHLIYRDDVGLIYVIDALYAESFASR